MKLLNIILFKDYWGFPHNWMGKESAFNAEDTGDVGLIPGLGSPLEVEMATHSSIFAWKIPGTEKPGGLQSKGLQSWPWLSTIPFVLRTILI